MEILPAFAGPQAARIRIRSSPIALCPLPPHVIFFGIMEVPTREYQHRRLPEIFPCIGGNLLHPCSGHRQQVPIMIVLSACNLCAGSPAAKAFRQIIHRMICLHCLLTFPGGTLRVPVCRRGTLSPCTPCKLLKKLEQNFYVLLCPGLVVSLPADTADQTRLQHPPNSMPMNFPAQAPTPHIPCRPISQAP